MIFATLSPRPATTSVPRAFPSSLLADPTSTRDLFTNPSRSTIPDWLLRRDRRARRNTGRCQRAASVSRNVRLSLAGTLTAWNERAARNNHVAGARTRRRPRRRATTGRPAYRRAYSRVYETRTTAHSIHVPPWGIRDHGLLCAKCT